jgi:hypothetical protein
MASYDVVSTIHQSLPPGGSRVVITSGEIHNAESPDGKNGAPPTLGDLAGMASGAGFEMCDGGEFDGNKVGGFDTKRVLSTSSRPTLHLLLLLLLCASV